MKKWTRLLLFSGIAFVFRSYAQQFQYPEPMVYDLMRGLDSKKGELELNALMLNQQEISPEVEYAVQDGLGAELETPTYNGQIQALKFGLQWTFYSQKKMIIGLQGIYEHFLKRNKKEITLTPIIDYKISENFSFVGIAGFTYPYYQYKIQQPLFILNMSIFYRVSNKTWIGIENDKNFYYLNGGLKVSTIPQLSWKLDKKLRLQTGVEYDWESRQMNFMGRFICEF